MKKFILVTAFAAFLIGSIGFIGGANAAKGGIPGPPDDGGGGGGEIPDFGDLIILHRDDDGVPIPSDPVLVQDPETGLLVDGGLCQQPIAFNVDDPALCPTECVVDTTDPATVAVNQFNCSVGFIDTETGLTTSCSNCTQEVDFGRVNAARSPVTVFESQLEDVVVNLAIADCTTLDPAGRLVASTVAADGTVTTSTIDSPLQNLAIYRELMLTGFLGDAANPIELPGDTLDTAARGLGVSSDKTGEVNVDLVAYLNSIMGLDDVPTILGKLCKTYREEVQGTIQLVEKCFLNYGPKASDIPPTPAGPPADYLYTRSDNFSTTVQSLPLPAYIPDEAAFGWFEYLAVLDPTLPSFQISQGPILDAVFCVDFLGVPVLPVNGVCPGIIDPGIIDPGFTDGNIGGFAQASDDTRAVINFMHDWPMPDADVYGTPVPCVASGDTAYDVSISEESGLQVPVTYINGTEREFIVAVANAGPDAATGTVTVTAVQTNGAAVPGSPWVYEFTDLGAGFSASFAEPFMIDLGTSTTITWTATVEAEFDVNPLNNTVTATTSVRNTGGGGGGDEQGGGHGPTHGIYTRDMAVDDSEIIRILDRTTLVPQPNNLETTFVETPSFPRIDMESDTIATRGNHQPVWTYSPPDSDETRAGTTGIYTNPFDDLITGAAKLGDVPAFSFFEVPEFPGIRFEVFPGAPSVTEGDTIVFKGNYTDPDGGARTGVYFRELVDDTINGGPGGGTLPVVLIANSTNTFIPGTDTVFGSTAPPSAAGQRVVFAGFDNEDAPTLGGIYLAPLMASPPLTELVSIGQRVPGESRNETFNGLGEGGAFDGRHVGFWGAWGEETRTVRLYCPTEGNKDRIAYCNQALVCEDTGETIGDENSICDDETDSCYQDKEVPVNQGIFVHDIDTRSTRVVAKTGAPFDEFLYWNYSGKTPCVGGGHSDEGAEDDGEPARWRSSAFVAVAGGVGATFNTAFKARTGELVDGVYMDPVDGIYLRRGPGQGQAIVTILDTTMDGQALDPEAPEGSTIAELGLEREGLRGDLLAISAKMGIEGGEEEDDMAGVYLARLPRK